MDVSQILLKTCWSFTTHSSRIVGVWFIFSPTKSTLSKFLTPEQNKEENPIWHPPALPFGPEITTKNCQSNRLSFQSPFSLPIDHMVSWELPLHVWHSLKPFVNIDHQAPVPTAVLRQREKINKSHHCCDYIKNRVEIKHIPKCHFHDMNYILAKSISGEQVHSWLKTFTANSKFAFMSHKFWKMLPPLYSKPLKKARNLQSDSSGSQREACPNEWYC